MGVKQLMTTIVTTMKVNGFHQHDGGGDDGVDDAAAAVVAMMTMHKPYHKHQSSQQLADLGT